MESIQLTAAYFIESIKNLLDETYQTKSQKLLECLSHFELESYESISDQLPNYPPILAVANNIISRGLPTRMPYSMEKKFSEIFNYLEEYPELGGSYFKLINIGSPKQFWEALHIIDPRLNQTNIKLDYEQSFEKLDSTYEENFLLQQIPNLLGVHFIQLLESHRYLNELLKFSEIPNDLQQNFINQRVDFSIEYPYKLDGSNQNGTIIEIDGSHHNQAAQQNLDNQRDQAAIQCNWQPIRIKTTEWNLLQQKLQPLIQLHNKDYFQNLEQNYNKSLVGEWLDTLQFILSPIAIARIQKTVIELLMRGVLNLNSDKWDICIIERDVPCAYLAIKDFEEFLGNLFFLESKERKLPQIDLTVYSTSEFINSKVNKVSQTIIKNLDNYKSDTNKYDVTIDISILQRSRLSPKLEFPNQPSHYFKIRSTHSVRTKRKIISSDLLEYPEFVKLDINSNYTVNEDYKNILEYFLKNIFRKNSFKVGQLPILSRALSLKNVIGLLPTGGGKSLTYQLAALLQPGITIIIDPIKSLMKDQVDGLKRNLIDYCLFINSSMNWKERKEAHKKIANGEVLFVFVTPERLQMDEFRQVLKSLFQNKHYFTYCVIDEAHCVSEWGHDFRTSYLHLGENATRHCWRKDTRIEVENEKEKIVNPINIFGLTATASFDVLADILREISNLDKPLDSDAIVRFETTNRPEIQYEVVQLNITPDNNNIWDIKKQLGKAKQDKINELLSIIPSKLSYYNDSSNQVEIFNDAYKDDPERVKLGQFDLEKEYERIRINNFTDDPINFYNAECTNAGLIFCPHRSWFFGVTDQYKNPPGNFGVFENIVTEFNIKKGTFIGVDNEDQNITDQINSDNIVNQDDFINNKLNLLVCTKAFGMGIDKPNIRFSIHLNYPQSIESFIQESGRIGRDSKLSLAYILFNDQPFDTNEGVKEIDKDILEDFHSNSFRGEAKEKAIIWELLNTITYPQKTNIDLINDFLEDKGYEAYVNFWTNNVLRRLYINPDLGFINLDYLIHNYNNVNNIPKAQETHQVIIEYINQNNSQNISLIQWLNNLNAQPMTNGIQTILENNREFKLPIGFSNDWGEIYNRISSFLSQLNIVKSPINIEKTYLYTQSGSKNRKLKFQDFYKALNINLSNQNKVSLEKIFYLFRDKQDTDKAVYRLSTLGIIDEYEVDYRTHTYTIRGKKKTDTEIEKKLGSYLKKYYSEQRVNTELHKIPSINVTDNSNYLHKCISFLISFIYKEIAKKRKQTINDMRSACIYRLEKSNTEFKDYIYYYFNSKYAREGYEEEFNGVKVNQSLYDIIETEKNDNIETIWKFIEFVGSEKTNFRHLRGACIRLLQLQPDYFSIHLLKAYAVFTIEQDNPTLLEDGKNDFIKGCDLYYEKIKYDNIVFFSFINKFINNINEHTINQLNPKIKQAISYVKLKAHNNWLEKTNTTLED